MITYRIARITAVIAALASPSAAWAATPADIAQTYGNEARQASPQFDGFSATRGRTFFQSPHGGEWSCSSCHTSNPLGTGKHARTGKSIAPLAPAADPERFTDSGVVAKWFRRNCNDVLGRLCTAKEKGDVLQYLMSLK